MADLIYREESHAIIGALFEVYKDKGHGFWEPVYQECMEIELALRGILFEAQKKLRIEYKDAVLMLSCILALVHLTAL